MAGLTYEGYSNEAPRYSLKGDGSPYRHRQDRPDCNAQLEQAANPAGFPAIPTDIKSTGLSTKFLDSLLLKSRYILGIETNVEIARHLKLSQLVADQLLNGLKQQGSLQVLGSVPGNVSILRYGLTNAGKEMAIEASRQCEYVGPAPVSLAAFQEQVRKQSIRFERISVPALSSGLSHIVLPQSMIKRLGPAVNSARAMLVYGPPGNGKTSISEAIGKIFRQPIYVPHCFEVDGQVIRVFDATVHSEVPLRRASDGADGDRTSLIRKKQDPRWVKCRRPVVIMGGELTLAMLDLEYDATSKFYEAPPQVKALGGVFIIDDFGRQVVQPQALLNRWIIPLERGVDYLTIHTGKKFDIPFDGLVIFSTNLSPNKLMDAALLRRVKYKLKINPPSVDDYILIFQKVCSKHGLELPQAVLDYLLEEYYPSTRTPLAGFHPIFFVEHAISACRYEGISPCLTVDIIKDALENLFVADSPDQELTGSGRSMHHTDIRAS